MPALPLSSLQKIAALREQLSAQEAGPRHKAPPLSSGCAALDRVLPAGGLPRGSLVEWLVEAEGGGAAVMALLAAREASREGGAVVVCDRLRHFYPPAAWSLGICPPQLVVVHPPTAADERWAIEQCLRCTGVAATWSYAERIDPTTFRRWQLAAETGGGLGLFVRPAHVRGSPTWSDLQLLVRPVAGSNERRGWRLRIEVVRCRGGPAGAAVELEIEEMPGLPEAPPDDATNSLPAFAELAHRAPARRAAGA